MMAHSSAFCTVCGMLALTGVALMPAPQAQAEQNSAIVLPQELLAGADPAPFDGGRMESELALRTALEQEDYETARGHAARLLELMEHEHGRDSAQLVEPLTLLAHTQRRTGEFVEAEQNLHRSMDLARRHEGRYSDALLDPMRELGFTYQDMREHNLAVTTLNEAQALSRRLEGLLNLEQVEIIRAIARSLLVLGARTQADERLDEAFRLEVRRHGEDSLDLLPALYEHANWQHRMLRFRRERALYMRAIELIEEQGGPRDMRLIRPLRGLAASIRGERSVSHNQRRHTPDTSGQTGPQRALERAREIARSQETPNHAIEARILVDLGDLHMAERRTEVALETYRDAWNLLDNEDAELLAEWFSAPRAVLHGQPRSSDIEPVGRDPELPEGIVVIDYRVDAAGVPRDLEVTESRPEGLMDANIRRSLERTRYRPVFIDGEPVDSDVQRHEFRFAYHP